MLSKEELPACMGKDGIITRPAIRSPRREWNMH